MHPLNPATRPSNYFYWGVLVSLVFFGMPMGMANSLSQQIATILMVPFILQVRSSLKISIPIVAGLFSVSLYQHLSDPLQNFSIFQFFRSGAPFICLVVIICGYREILVSLDRAMGPASGRSYNPLLVAIYLFCSGQLLQTTLFFVGVPLANSSFSSGDSGRIFIVQMTSTMIIFFFACYSQRLLLMSITTLVLLAAGSKSIIATVMILICLAIFRRTTVSRFFLYIAALGVFTSLVIFINPLAISRLSTYSSSGMEDTTRDWEIGYAQVSFASGVDTIFFGNGLAKPLTPGIPTNDPRWFENSQYDIENGYWSLLAKLGVIGTGVLAVLFLSLPLTVVSVAVIAIELIIAFGSSGLFFTNYDGPYLIIWSLVLSCLLYGTGQPTAKLRSTLSRERLGRSFRLRNQRN